MKTTSTLAKKIAEMRQVEEEAAQLFTEKEITWCQEEAHRLYAIFNDNKFSIGTKIGKKDYLFERMHYRKFPDEIRKKFADLSGIPIEHVFVEETGESSINQDSWLILKEFDDKIF